jgi:hypothetical protein
MRLAFRAVASLSAVAALVTACSSSSTAPIDNAVPTVLARQSAGTGGATGGGSNSNSNSIPVDPSIPVLSFTGRITKVGAVPVIYYTTTPSDWDIDGVNYTTTAGTVVKAPAGPLVVGACVNYAITAVGSTVIADIKTVIEDKCVKAGK